RFGHGDREHAAFARFAGELDFAAEDAREFARDRQAEAGTAELAVRRTVGLAEGVEDRVLVFGCNADTGVADGKGHVAVRRAADRQCYLAAFGELDGVRQQVLQHLFEALRVRADFVWRSGLHGAAELQVLRL